jgi:hypothetical protein
MPSKNAMPLSTATVPSPVSVSSSRLCAFSPGTAGQLDETADSIGAAGPSTEVRIVAAAPCRRHSKHATAIDAHLSSIPSMF